jgi:hypothetical protein
MLTPAGENLFHPIFLPKIALADELDLNARCGRHFLGVLTDPVAEWLGKLPLVEDPNLSLRQKRSHPFGKTDSGQGTKDQHPIPTPQYSRDLIPMPISQ